jgi:hypothetical protein
MLSTGELARTIFNATFVENYRRDLIREGE